MPFLAIPAVAIGLAGAAAAATATTAVVAAQQKAAADRFNSQQAANAAQVSSWNRQQQDQQFARQSLIADQQGSQEASRLEMQNGALEAKNINNAAASGVTLSGSTRDAVFSTALNGEYNSLDAAYRGNLRAYQAQTEGSTATYNDEIQTQKDQNQSVLFSSEASNASTGGFLSAGGALLTGAAGGVNTAYNAGYFN